MSTPDDAKAPAPPTPAPKERARSKVPSLRESRLEMYRGLGGYGTLGLEIVLSMLFGLLGGQWLDGKMGTAYWVWIGMALGVGMSVRAIQRAVTDMKRVAQREEAAEGNPTPLFETDSDRVHRERERERSATPKDDSLGGSIRPPGAPRPPDSDETAPPKDEAS
ncbi:MAG: AtpZ/AtpI family protein [Polyangiaceae bacterium]